MSVSLRLSTNHVHSVHELTQKRSLKGTLDKQGVKKWSLKDKLSRLTSMTKSALRAKRGITFKELDKNRVEYGLEGTGN